MPAEELNSLVSAARQRQSEERVKLAEAKERARFFHRPDAAADFDFWSKTAHWTIDEAIALSLGKAPHIVDLKSVQAHVGPNIDGLPPSPFAVEYTSRWELARRALAWKQLYDPILPTLFLAWAQRLEIPVAPELTQAVERRGLVIADWRDLHDKQRELALGWKQKFDELLVRRPRSPATWRLME
jgi:hypothetical protein